MPTPEPSSLAPTIILSSTAFAAACLASFFDRPVPIAVNMIIPHMKQNQQDYGLWEVMSCRVADSTNKVKEKVPSTHLTVGWVGPTAAPHKKENSLPVSTNSIMECQKAVCCCNPNIITLQLKIHHHENLIAC